MRGEPDLFGEIHEDEIVKIARKAAKKRGYAIYDDYYEYMWQLICQSPPKPVRAGRFFHYIRGTLLEDGWVHRPRHAETRFYPPGTDLDQTNQLKL